VSKTRVKPRTLAERMDRLVLVQAHVSGLLIFGAALFARGWRSRITLHTGYGRAAAVFLWVAALAGLVAAIGPWLWQLRVAAQRRLIAAALVGCAGGLVAILPSIGYTPLFGAQAMLTAAVLTGSRDTQGRDGVALDVRDHAGGDRIHLLAGIRAVFFA
jgi:ammonia channel protein AmtB